MGKGVLGWFVWASRGQGQCLVLLGSMSQLACNSDMQQPRTLALASQAGASLEGCLVGRRLCRVCL